MKIFRICTKYTNFVISYSMKSVYILNVNLLYLETCTFISKKTCFEVYNLARINILVITSSIQVYIILLVPFLPPMLSMSELRWFWPFRRYLYWRPPELSFMYQCFWFVGDWSDWPGELSPLDCPLLSRLFPLSLKRFAGGKRLTYCTCTK